MNYALVVSIIAVIISFFSALVSYWTYSSSESKRDEAKKIFQLAHAFDLHKAWMDAKQIDPENPVEVDVIRANNILELTADLWLFDIVNKDLLMSYWPNFEMLYEGLNKSTKPLPKQQTSPKMMLSDKIKKVFEDMKKRQLGKIEEKKI